MPSNSLPTSASTTGQQPQVSDVEGRIEEIRARLADVTPGPWAVETDGACVWHLGSGGTICEVNFDHQTGDHQPGGDQAFIANAPSDIAYLLDQLASRRLRGNPMIPTQENNMSETVAAPSKAEMPEAVAANIESARESARGSRMTPESANAAIVWLADDRGRLLARITGLAKERDAWRDFAGHQRRCADCAESVASCPIGTAMLVAAVDACEDTNASR